VKRLLVIAMFGGCAWGAFDDLADTTPARAQEKPEGLKSATDYGFAVVGATQGDTGGTLAVLSTSSGNYSTLTYDQNGKSTLGDNEALGIHTIDSLTPNAILLSNGAGQAAIVDNGNSAVIVGIHGPVAGLSADMQVPTSSHPDAALYAGDRLLIFAAPDNTTPMMTNAYNLLANVSCKLLDDTAMPLSVAAVGADATHLWVWTKAGKFFGYPIAVLDNASCTGAPTAVVMTTAPPANGGHVDVIGNFAVLTSFDTPASQSGQVTVVNLVTLAAVGTPLIAHGVHSAALDMLDGGHAMVVLGYPERASGGTSNAGEVDLHTLDLVGGTLGPTPSQTLSIPQADQDLSFGRSVTTMRFNGAPIVVVAATNVVYAYLATALYTKR
jgi:hypothetical protein